MMVENDISVVIPAYNAAAFIAEAPIWPNSPGWLQAALALLPRMAPDA